MSDNPIVPRQIDHVVLRVRDVDAMIAFYVEVLGCARDREVADLGLYQLRAGAALIDLVDVTGKLGRSGGAAPGADARNLDHFCLILDDFDPNAIAAHLARHGVRASDPVERYGATGMGMSIYITDPEGNAVELKAPPAASSG